MLGTNSIRPTANTYYMYRHFGTELLDASSTTPDVTVYAAQREDGAVTLMVVNLGPTDAQTTL
ncbi:MAG: hypothetical protein MUC99_06420, partial [Anaerolineae bacterium]|nr:hypothetical protein [Anaerolineae bacterium]